VTADDDGRPLSLRRERVPGRSKSPHRERAPGRSNSVDPRRRSVVRGGDHRYL